MNPYEPGNSTENSDARESKPQKTGGISFVAFLWNSLLTLLLSFAYFEWFPWMQQEVLDVFSYTSADFFFLRDVVEIVFLFSLPALFVVLFSTSMLRPRGNGVRVVYVLLVLVGGVLGARPNQLADGALTLSRPELGIQSAAIFAALFLPAIAWRCGWIGILSYVVRIGRRLVRARARANT